MSRGLRILVVDSGEGNGLPWMLRCQDDGHSVKYFCNHPKATNVGKGLVERVDDYRPWIRWCDYVMLTDNSKYLKELDNWRKEGIKVVGPTWDAAQWELDRLLGMKVLEKAGIECPAYREFSDYDQAIAYVKKEGRRFVSKPCGSVEDKSLSYVSHDAADMIYMLQRWRKSGKIKGSFLLQEFIGGIEFAVGGWFGPGGFNEGWEVNWEHKKLFNDDKGPNTGETGTALAYAKKEKLANKVLKPLEEALDKVGFIGSVDVNCIIDEKGKAWPLEFTMRCGWPAFDIHQALHNSDHGEWLLDLAEGRDAKAFTLDTPCVGVLLAIPDFPYSHATQKEITGVPIYGVTEKNRASIQPCMVMVGEAPQMVDGKVVTTPCWVSAGDYILVATGTGATFDAARKKAYSTIKQISMPNSPFFRTDIGKRLAKQLPELQKHGYATGFTY